MRVLLISTYDLGRQPFGLASPLAWLRRAGVEADTLDLSREPLGDEAPPDAAWIAAALTPSSVKGAAAAGVGSAAPDPWNAYPSWRVGA